MVVGDEDVADVLQLHPGADQLFGHAIAAVDDMGGPAMQDDAGGHVARPAHRRPAQGAQDDQLGGAGVRGLGDGLGPDAEG